MCQFEEIRPDESETTICVPQFKPVSEFLTLIPLLAQVLSGTKAARSNPLNIAFKKRAKYGLEVLN
jgi:hypothetical protein